MTWQYGETLFDHFRQPCNHGALSPPDVAYEDVNPLCGDRLRMELHVDAEQRWTQSRHANSARACACRQRYSTRAVSDEATAVERVNNHGLQ
jgi:nitrogen fixation protein NifU and related proteins